MPVIGLECELLSTPRLGPPQKKLQLHNGALAAAGTLTKCVKCADKPAPLPSGVMTQNGGRLYVDGEFLEAASPEVSNPRDALVYLWAMERLLLTALKKSAAALSLDPNTARLIRRCDDGAGHHLGFHVNVQTRHFAAPSIVEHLVPFLVTRFYGLAGGLGPDGFTLSQKHRAVRTVASNDSRNQRGIVHLKNEPLASNGSRRVHICHGDMCMSELGCLLTVGATALVVRMLDDGACVGPAYRLSDPIDALRRLDTDYEWSRPLPLASGGAAAAIDIQEHYCQAAARYARLCGEAWMLDVVERWQWALDRLRAKGPSGLADSFDAFIKMRLYQGLLRQHGLTLAEFGLWCGPVHATREYLSAPEARDCRDVQGFLRERMARVPLDFLCEQMARDGLGWVHLQRAVTIYDQILALDFRYHDTDPAGLYYRLREAGVVDAGLVDDGEVARAMHTPPPDTRAAARGRAIALVAGQPGAVANWLEVRNAKQRMLLADPQSPCGEWKAIQPRARKK